ncbi:MAG: hypothetical protein EOO73_12425 [Myxococcales bacterium]|nr:MAG: hypothetical protein EOO73_12425 [Myxococcales bacterium]
MRVRASSVLLLGAWLCGVVGCSDDSEASNKDEFISRLCVEYMSCCKAAGRPSDGAQCRAFFGAFAPTGAYDPAAAEACLSEVRALEDHCDTSSTSSPSCGKVFSSGGTKKPGEPCENNTDCAAPESGEVQCESDFVEGATVTQCQVRLPGTEGSMPCLGTRDGNVTIYSGVNGSPSTGYICDKAKGLACNGQTGACERLAAVGEPCSGGSSQCVQAAYCDLATRLCQARLELGAACTSDDQCPESSYCDRGSQVCEAHHAPGEACTTDNQCAADDCTNEKCGAGNDITVTFLCGN